MDRRRSPKPGAPRTEVFGLRLDPKLKYLVEILARRQRRSLANVIEWLVEDGLERHTLYEGDQQTVMDLGDELWDIDEPERLVKLAINYPHLLTLEEEALWKQVRIRPRFWKNVRNTKKLGLQYSWDQIGNLKDHELRKHWETVKRIARGELPEEALRRWEPESDSDSDQGGVISNTIR
jgi:hypothetical protein